MIAVYLRVSSVSQSLESQKSVVDKYLEGNGLRNTELYCDVSTGDDTDRPEFKRLQKDIFDGSIDTVIVYKLDRLSRSTRGGINVLCDWLEKDVRVVSVTQQLDFSGVTGKLVASVLFAVAEMEQETRRERQAAGIAVAKAKGKFRGGKRGRRKVKPKRAYDLYKQGYEYQRIANILDVSYRSVRRYVREETKKREG